jgi:hypothetical protein
VVGGATDKRVGGVEHGFYRVANVVRRAMCGEQDEGERFSLGIACGGELASGVREDARTLARFGALEKRGEGGEGGLLRRDGARCEGE